MRTKMGDRVLVHYVRRFADGTQSSSRAGGREPVEVTVGTPDPRLPGLGRELVGLSPGQDVFVVIPAGRGIPAADPARVVRVARSRFPADQALHVGSRVRLAGRSGRERAVRVVRVSDRFVVVDANHPRAGQEVELEVALVAILAPAVS